jgi:CheY-like chemotaxis protein
MKLADWRVLVVEDEADSMEVVQQILEFQSIQCLPAPSAEDALEILESTIPTLVVIDLALPGMNGWDLLEEMKGNARWSRIPCVAVTAYHSLEVAQEAIAVGFDAYFPKPIEATSFVRELRTIVEG